MNKTSKKVLGIVGVMTIVATSFHAGMEYGGGITLGMVAENLVHITEQEAIEVAKSNRKHSYPTWKDIVYEIGVKNGFK